VQQQVNRTTTPTTATYESGQRPSIVPLHFDPSLVVAYSTTTVLMIRPVALLQFSGLLTLAEWNLPFRV
jgi:hypothetical protein